MKQLVRLIVMATVGFAVLTASIPQADAHRDDQSYLYLDIGTGVQARLQMPFGDIDTVLGIELGGDDDQVEAGIEANAEALRAYAAEHVTLGTPDQPWTITPTEVRRAEEGLDFVEVLFEVDTGESDVAITEVEVTLDPFFDEIDNRDALLLVGNDWVRGIVDSEADQLVRLTPDSRTASAELGDSSQWKNLSASIGLGVDHIRTGPDHMLFIVALLLPSVLIWRKEWLPAKGFGSTLLRLTKIMTMFTLAHSVTFSLTALGLVPSPGAKVTETIIALSIAATALHSLRPIIVNREWIIALAFGLFHGFGFASLVQELEVSTQTELVSLLGRNIGIEIGQLFVVLLTFPALFLLRVTRYYRPAFVVGCIGLILVSLGWAIERIFETSPFTSDIVDKITKFPRVLWLIAIGTAIAAGIYFFERSRDRLIDPVARKVETA